MISMILPTKGNPEALFQCIYDMNERADNPRNVEIVLVVDDNDEKMQDFYGPCNCMKISVKSGLRMGELMNIGAEMSSGSLIMAMNDDCFIRTSGWDTKILATREKFKDEMFLFWPNDTIFGPRLSCFFGFSRKLYTLLGEFGPREFIKYSIDPFVYTTFLELRNRGFDRMIYLEDVVFEHMNKAEIRPGVFDYAGGNAEMQAKDEAIFRQLLPRMQAHVNRIVEVIQHG